MKSNTDLIIEPAAEDDIREILQYTLETWGDEQVERYWSVLWEAFQRIQAFPELGRATLTPREREYLLRHHTIVYSYEGNIVTILRVANPRQRRFRQ